MSTTGELTKTENGYEGFIADLGFDADITLTPNGRKTKESQPDFIVTGKSPRGRAIEIGAAWWRDSKAGNRFLSLSLNLMGAEHRVNALLQDDDPDQLDIRPWAVG